MRKLDFFLIALFTLLTIGLATLRYQTSQASAEQEFNRLTMDGMKALETRMDSYLHSLTGVAAFISASENVTAAEFDSYVGSLNVERFLPGVRAIGLIETVSSADLEAFVADARVNGLANFRVHPPLDVDEHFVISHIAPLDRHRAILGLDVRYDAVREGALMLSRASDQPWLTGHIELGVGEAKQIGFTLVMPVREMDADGISRERWIFAPFVGSEILTKLTPSLGSSYEIAIYDSNTISPQTLVYNSDPDRENQGAFRRIYQTENAGRTWTVVYHSTPVFDALFKKYAHLLILMAGTILTVMLIIALRSLSFRSEAVAEVAELRARKLNAQEDEKSSILENAVSAVFILDDSNRVLSANKAAMDMFGYDASEMPTKDFRALVRMERQQDTGDRHNAIGRTKAGSELLLDVQRNGWKSFDDLLRNTIIVHDLTEEIRIQNELKNTKTLYDLALQGAQIGVFDLDLNSGTSDVTDTWRRIMGYQGDGQGANTKTLFLDRVHPEDRHILINSDNACIRGETERSISEYRVRFDTDEGVVWRWMKSDAIVVERDKTGKATRLIGTQTDVTGLRHSRNALEASEKRFRKVLAVAPVGMVMMDDQGVITGVNAAFCTVSGYSEDQLMARMRMADLIPPEGRGPIYRGVAAMVAGRGDLYQGEHQVVHSSGELRWCFFRVSWVYDKNKDRNIYVAQVLDITDQKKVEQMKNEFVATVSHELRTPLTSIKGALGLITATSGDTLTPPMRRLVDIASTNADRLTSIVNDILDLEKISSGEVMFNLDSVNMGDLIADTLVEMSPFIKTHNALVDVDMPDEALQIWADPGRTKQVLVNLLSNACKYSPENSTVRIKAEMLDDRAIFYIQNEGPGIPENFHSRIFKAFSQADSSDTRAKGGTGLGLNITRQIVTRHGGEIGFESVPNRVTVFWFTCPLARSHKIAPEVNLQLTATKRDSGKIKVLHIEGDLDFAEVIRSGLGKVADVSHAKTLSEARKSLKSENFDVIVLDWTLPDGDAADLLDEVWSADKRARVVSLSADGGRPVDSRVSGHLIKSRTDLAGISACVLGSAAQAS